MTAAGEHSDDQAPGTASDPASTQDDKSPDTAPPNTPAEPVEPSATPAGEPPSAATPSEPPAEPDSGMPESPPLPFPEAEKQALIASMTALGDSEMHLATRARRIHALQESWHAHGTPDESDPLWQQFNELGRLAFEPCKTYFQERKKLMRHNLAERKQICEQLEAWAASLNDEKDADIGEINRLEKQAREQWKKYAPVPQKQVAALQGRFNDVLKALRNARRKTLLAHAARKKELVGQAEALLAAEDLQGALQEAKRLQKEWKKIGPAPHKEERQLWETFRKHCDALFARRPAPSGKAGPKRGAAARDAQAGTKPGARGGRPTAPRIARKHQSLLDALAPAAQLCREAEEQRLAGQSPDTAALQAEWEAIELPSNESSRQLLEQRYAQLTGDSEDGKALQTQLTANTEQARLLCIELEIQAGIDSPPEDRPLRMQRQLEHLKQGLGQGLADASTRSQKLGEALITLLCTGPLKPDDRAAFEKRLLRIR